MNNDAMELERIEGEDVQSCGISICPACEEDLCLPGEKFCRFCCALRNALKDRMDYRAATLQDQQRINVGTLTMADAMPPMQGRVSWRRVASWRLGTATYLAGLCWLGWYGIRYFCELGIRFAAWWER